MKQGQFDKENVFVLLDTRFAIFYCFNPKPQIPSVHLIDDITIRKMTSMKILGRLLNLSEKFHTLAKMFSMYI